MKSLRIILLLAVLTVAFAVNTFAVIDGTSYPFSNASGVALEDMTGSTDLLTGGNLDDDSTALTGIGFSFDFDGTTYTQFSVNANGLMRLGTAISGAAFTNDLASTSNNPKIVAIWDDLCTSSSGGGGTVHFKVVGSAPNRKLVVEWKNMKNRSTTCSAVPDDTMTFQVWLSEGSNRIDFVYGGFGTVTGLTYSTGLATSTTNYANVDTSTPAATYGTGENNSQSFTIPDGEQFSFVPGGIGGPGTIQFSAMTFDIAENAGTTSLSLMRTGGSVGAVSVDYAFTDGSATGGAVCGAGIDFVNTGGTVNFADGATTGSVPVTICSDAISDFGESFTATLSNPMGGATIGVNNPATVNIDEVIGTFPYFQDFETNSDGWTVGNTIGSPSDWEFGTPTTAQISGAFSGVNAWVTDLDANYSTSTTSTLNSPTFDFSSLTGRPTLTFWHNFSTESNFDGGVLEVSTDGATWSKVDPNLGTGGTFDTTDSTGWYNNNSASGGSTGVTPPKFSGTSTAYTGNSSGWVQATTLLPMSLVGETSVQFRWRFGSDVSVTSEGWGIDDVSITPPSSGVVQFSSTMYSDDEGMMATITATRTGGSGGAVSVDYATSAGTATAGTCGAGGDYVDTNGTLNWADGDAMPKTFMVTLCSDAVTDDGETVNLTLSNPMGGVAVGANNPATLTINDVPPPSHQFSSTTYLEDESQMAVITVTRTNDTSGASSVDYATPPGGTATAGTCGSGGDYVATSGTLNFAATETSKTFMVQLCADLKDPGETVNLALSNPVGGTLGTPNTAMLMINDTAATDTNMTPILVPGAGTGSSTPPHSPGAPYPSTINVSNFPGVLATIRVTLFDVQHTFSDDIDILLVGPGGQTFVLMADAGGATGTDVTTTITFDDASPTILPNSGVIATGTYEPANYEGTVSDFPTPAPAGPYNEPGSSLQQFGGITMNDVFGNTSPNGNWNLYVRDDAGGDSGVIGGWGIQFTAPTAANALVSGRVVTPGGRGIYGARIVMNDFAGNTRMARTNPFGFFRFNDVGVGQTYVFSAFHKSYQFDGPVAVQINDNFDGVNFTGSRSKSGNTNLTYFDNAPFDFDGDGISDKSVWRDSDNSWYIQRSSDGEFYRQAFGVSGDQLAPADFDGDGKWDISVFRPSEGRWYIWLSSTDSLRVEEFASTGDVPLPSDYDGDGKADLAVWREGKNVFLIKQSSDDQTLERSFRNTGTKVLPRVADYDGDGKADPAIYNRSNGDWLIRQSQNGDTVHINIGGKDDVPILADFDGDGQADLAVFQSDQGVWTIKQSRDGKIINTRNEENVGNQPVIGDFDGDARTDTAVFQDGNWIIKSSVTEFVRRQQFGLPTDRSIPSIYVR